MEHSGSGTWAGRWSIFLGVCLALIAAGSFVAFSLVAREAGVSGLTGRVEARRLATTSPLIKLGEPPRDEEPRPSEGGTERPAPDADLVLGTRVTSVTPPPSPPRKDGGPRGSSGEGSGMEPVARLTPAAGKAHKAHKAVKAHKARHKAHKGGGPSAGHPHKRAPQRPSHSNSGPKKAPEPQGEAKGHDKARGKGHHKHPGGH